MTVQRRARGYLMMEAMVGGAMAGAVLLGMLSLVAEARTKNIIAARDITANQLVTEAIEQTRAGPFPPVASGPIVLQAAGGAYRRTIAVSAAACPELRPNPNGVGPLNFSLTCRDVTVTVTYTALAATRVTEATLRMYL